MKTADGSTVIGKSVTIRGDLSGKEDLFMDGDIEGTITLHESTLTVGANARVVADINARDVIVLGSVSGNLLASGRVELRQTATVQGDISAARLSIEDNAILKGRVELKASDAASADRSPTSRTTPSQEAFALEPKA